MNERQRENRETGGLTGNAIALTSISNEV